METVHMLQPPVSSRATQTAQQASRPRRILARRLSLLGLAALLVSAALPITGSLAGNALPSSQGSGQHRGAWLVTFKSGVAAGDADGSLAAAGATDRKSTRLNSSHSR